jgi:hypothetical protein
VTTPVTVAQATRIRLRRAWSADWDRINPVLTAGEPGYDRTLNMLKIGDGVTPWRELSYLTPPPGSTPTASTPVEYPTAVSLAEHEADVTPHAVYDNGPSLVLIYQNAKV